MVWRQRRGYSVEESILKPGNCLGLRWPVWDLVTMRVGAGEGELAVIEEGTVGSEIGGMVGEDWSIRAGEGLWAGEVLSVLVGNKSVGGTKGRGLCLGELGQWEGDGDSAGVVELVAVCEGREIAIVLGAGDVEVSEGRVRELPGIAVTVQEPWERFVPLAGKWDSSNTTCLEM
jgi:hypothetical protein